MSLILLHIDFATKGPWGDGLVEACRRLADDIATEPGLLWKVWTEDREGGRAGGEYLFDNRADAQRYLEKHVPRVQAFGATDIQSRLFEVNAALSRITHAPLSR